MAEGQVAEGHGQVRSSTSESGHVARLTIDRPEAGNVLSVAMIRQFAGELSRLERDDNVKVIVIDGAGPDLCAGLDPAEAGLLHERVTATPAQRVPSLRARLQAHDELFWGDGGLYSRLLHCKKVTILAAAGQCLDAGLYLALYCDIAIAAETARFGNPRWRHVGVDGDVSMLIATVGRKRANELMFAGRLWTAREAESAGLVNRCVPAGADLAAALEVARTVSTIMRDGIAAEKALTLASTEKMAIGTGFAVATIMGAMGSLVHFRDGEFSFLRARRNDGLESALRQAADAKRGARLPPRKSSRSKELCGNSQRVEGH